MNSVITYPNAISRACAAIDEAAAFQGMPDGFIRVLVRIIKKINLDCLCSPIFASRGTLAEESGKSLETVGRAIKWLEDNGLIQRNKKARAGLKGSSSPLVPTHALLEALCLAETKTNSSQFQEALADTANGCKPRPPVSNDGSISPKNNLSENNQASPRAFTKSSGVIIPTDLAWLTRNGLSAFGVLKLMKTASKFKKRLSDVVAVTREKILNFQGRELYAYLSALLNKDRDYAYQAQQEKQTNLDKQSKALFENKIQELQGRRYLSRDGSVQVTVESTAMLSEVRNGVRFARPISQAFLDAVAEGRLMPIS